jgi:hypothetical protein
MSWLGLELDLAGPMPAGSWLASGLLRELGLGSLVDALASRPVRREVECLDPRALDELDAWTPGRPRMGAFFRVWAPGEPGLLERMKRRPEVLHAWWDRPTGPCSGGSLADGDGVLGTDDERQEHLGPAPLGLGARWAWRHTRGAGVRFVDVETSWQEHRDLPPLPEPVPRGARNLGRGLHGVRSLGTVLANSPGRGCMGVAPEATLAGLASTAQEVPGVGLGEDFVADAIYAARALLDVQVLLLEVQRAPGLPLEWHPPDRVAITEATRAGVVVVQPAGNAGVDLDRIEDSRGHRPFAPGAPDSGSILVGARMPGTGSLVGNHGARVDCWSWGHRVVTTGGVLVTAPDQDAPHYTRVFRGTSSAAALVAGCAVLLLSAGATGVRALIRDPGLGTPGPAEGPDLGPQPDLRRLLEHLSGPG